MKTSNVARVILCWRPAVSGNLGFMEALTGERLLLGLPGRLEQCLSGKSSKVSRVVSRQEIAGRVETTDPYSLPLQKPWDSGSTGWHVAAEKTSPSMRAHQKPKLRNFNTRSIFYFLKCA